MIGLLDANCSDHIRAALKDANKKGKLSVVAAVTGITGGTRRLRELMRSSGEIDIMERGMLMTLLD